jgi:hypothetical protein
VVDDILIVFGDGVSIEGHDDDAYGNGPQVYKVPFRAVVGNEGDAVAFLEAQLKEGASHSLGFTGDLFGAVGDPFAVGFSSDTVWTGVLL